VSARREEICEVVLRLGEHVRAHDADDVETLRVRNVVKGGLEAVAVV
jgi:hypothetical protein